MANDRREKHSCGISPGVAALIAIAIAMAMATGGGARAQEPAPVAQVGLAAPPAAPAKPGPESQDCPVCPKIVTLPDGSAMGKYPVTRGEFAVFARETKFSGVGCYRNKGKDWFKDEKASWRAPGFPQTDRHPVVCVSWDDATAYAEWLGKRTGKQYRLPTIEESIAAEAAQGAFWWGDNADDICKYANVGDIGYVATVKDTRAPVPCKDGFVYTAPVGSFPANAFGLHDLAGNVWQWTNSCVKGDCSNAVFRGGAFNDTDVGNFKAGYSWGDRVIVRSFGLGFRVLRANQ